MKERLLDVPKREIVQILTLAPASWSRNKIAETFQVSEYMVRKARTLAKEEGICSLPDPGAGKKLPSKTIKCVQDFYEDDEFSRIMPGAKDFVSIGKNEHVQKRLILCNLKELYTAFKENHSDLKIGFSKFCCLRPKWCVLAGSTGTHSVCVCTIHQNVQLLLNALNMKSDFSDKIINQMVCKSENRDCNRDASRNSVGIKKDQAARVE